MKNQSFMAMENKQETIYVKDVVNALILSSNVDSNLFLNIGTG